MSTITQEQAIVFNKQFSHLMEKYWNEYSEVKKTKDDELVNTVHRKYGNKIRKKIADFDDFFKEERLRSKKGRLGVQKVDEEILEAHDVI